MSDIHARLMDLLQSPPSSTSDFVDWVRDAASLLEIAAGTIERQAIELEELRGAIE